VSDVTNTSGIDIQYAVSADGMPTEAQLAGWASEALGERASETELSIRIVDEAEITALNREYRGKDGPTNVLSFPFEPMPGVESKLIGDIVICAPVVVEEAISQDKATQAHWAHMVVHGTLHLLGYDHLHDAAAERMENREKDILDALGFPDPYR
jgi:probable rRNA maturation factor